MSYDPAKFGDHSHLDSDVVMNLVCHLIMQDHVIQGSYDFMGGSTSL